ncbi:anti-sigma-F factor Fin family protein [Paenibacillus sp. GSMTC-2017]|uniref:anti-sigma-F factor Fin family protein n=1 Tax=Paenibacillus sp. GSMTC-2017 TaxID=2794350 RepID=UPI0018D80249|nr:anti-sigma-F factor Fin family protein [Paenibacillus sp. GSMTC-2017]MBH5320722.1 anti-sigma-F factor Fin family protein [Paenibacillus sp. GSMTC-2017]
MAVNYICRHCKTSMGSLESTSITEQQLGFHFLTPEERNDIIAYDLNGDVTVKVVCDYCNEALNTNPDLMLVSNPLQ